MEKEISRELTEQWETIGKRFQELLEPVKQLQDMFETALEPLREMWEQLSKNLPWVFCNIVLEAIEAGDFKFIDSFVRNGIFIKPSLNESRTRYNSLSIIRIGDSGSVRICSRCGSHDINIHQIGYWWAGDSIRAICMDCGFKVKWGTAYTSGQPGAVEGHSVIMEAALLIWATQDQWRKSNHPLKYIRKIVKKNFTWQDFDVDRIQEGKRYPGSLFHGWGHHKKEPKSCISYDLMSELGERWIETDRESWLADEHEAFTQACYEPQTNPDKPLKGYELVFDRTQGVSGVSTIQQEEDISKYPIPKNERVKELNRIGKYIESKFMFDGERGRVAPPRLLPGSVRGKYLEAGKDTFDFRKWITRPEKRDNRKCYQGCKVTPVYEIPYKVTLLFKRIRSDNNNYCVELFSKTIFNPAKSKLKYPGGRIVKDPHTCCGIPVIQTEIEFHLIRDIAPLGNVNILANSYDYADSAASLFAKGRYSAYHTENFTVQDEKDGFVYDSYIYHGKSRVRSTAGTYGEIENNLIARMDTERAILRAGLIKDDVEVALSWDCKPKTKGKLKFAYSHLNSFICYGGAPPKYNSCGNMVIVDKKWTMNRVNASMQRIKRAISGNRLNKTTVIESCLTIGEKVLREPAKWPRIHYRDGGFRVEP